MNGRCSFGYMLFTVLPSLIFFFFYAPHTFFLFYFKFVNSREIRLARSWDIIVSFMFLSLQVTYWLVDSGWSVHPVKFGDC